MVQTSIASWLVSKATASRAPAVLPSGETQQHDLELLPAADSKPRANLPSRSATGSSLRSNGVSTESIPALLSNVSLEPITPSNVNSFRQHIAVLLPIPYPDGFYVETLNDPVISALSRIALWHQVPVARGVDGRATELLTRQSGQAQLVAGIRCRLLDHAPGEPQELQPILYISTITTLAPFRRHALASQLLDVVARTAFQKHGIAAIMAHVWEANEEGMQWYKNRGFRIVGRAEGYYRRLAPQTAAWVVRKDIGAKEALEWGAGGSW